MKNKLIIALDVPTANAARETTARLRGAAGMFKIGSQLFTAAGPELVREIVAAGERVFLDLKFHDIPNTVAAACVEAARLGASIVNVHALGGSEMMRRAAAAVRDASAWENIPPPALIGVTVLTSAEQKTLTEVGISSDIEPEVLRLANLAAGAGLDGVVASPHEITSIRAAVGRSDFMIVTPGVRPAGVSHDDQKRVMTPAEAIRAGADYLVVGRAITGAADPVAAAQAIIAEMEEGARTIREA
jgi:orotidine-5'-phosphate decarboxylase